VNLPCPIISPSPDAAPFWAAAQRRELSLPWCEQCGKFFWYPRTACPSCGSRELSWRPASGRGRVYTFCIHHHSLLPCFRDVLPFVTAIVELEEGPRLMTLLTDVAPDPGAINCDMPVVVEFVEVDAGHVLPVFRPEAV
jgi:uncharacterized OB-fold protein